MKLIYIYFDFTNGGENPEGYRGFTKCSLNFGTDYYFWMEEQEDKSYILKRMPRPEGEKIEPGFWEDKRLYNVSALVGDNGTGKSTIIHAIIHSLVVDSDEPVFERLTGVILLQDSKKYYLRTNRIQLRDPLPEFVSVNSKDDLKSLIDKTKLIYFSNALSLSDVRLFESITQKSLSNKQEGILYTQPFYDCSLVSDMNWAMQVSGVSEDLINRHLDTYLNFRSYQEARYVFDRGQRKLLNEMKDKYNFPVPVPSVLTLQINPALPEIGRLYRDSNDEILPEFALSYKRHFLSCNETEALITELCMHCVACFGMYIREVYNFKYLRMPTADSFRSRETYIELLENINTIVLDDSDPYYVEKAAEKKELYESCKKYINFLWDNSELIGRHEYFQIEKHKGFRKSLNIFPFFFVRCSIFLGREIENELEEFMIQFVNLTRAVSKWSYFVVYNWGLSSGESNLLHMFTKLRYLLQGRIYDDTNPECIKNYKNTICDSVILFIDEADLTLHPDWQRQLVAILAFFLPKLYKEEHGCRSIQIILGTHSPIMLGDFPAPCVIYLQRNEDGTIEVNDQNKLQPFGQNIYTILKDGFYLKKGTLGELARRKIENVLHDIGNIRERGEEFKKHSVREWEKRLSAHRKMTVQYLPKGIIRNKLEDELSICERILNEENQRDNGATAETNERNPKIREIEDRIARLNRQLEELKRGGAE